MKTIILILIKFRILNNNNNNNNLTLTNKILIKHKILFLKNQVYNSSNFKINFNKIMK